jgi:hypothetical protein
MTEVILCQFLGLGPKEKQQKPQKTQLLLPASSFFILFIYLFIGEAGV